VRLRPELRLILLLLLSGAASAMAANESPGKPEIDRAIEKVRKDPDLAEERTRHTIEWDETRERKEPHANGKNPGWLQWLIDLMSWITESSRLLLLLLLTGLVALVAIFLLRVLPSGRFGKSAKTFVAPTHVRDLDIRPESLPDDIGAAARALWDRGDQRAALALLYRGLMSRLAHVHQVQIRDSSTEGDCLRMASAILDAPRTAYVTQLVRTWQGAIYGGLSIETPAVHELAAGFARNLDLSMPASAPRNTGFAEGAA
jgi:hypothetical protein